MKKKRKNYLPTFILTLALWGALALMLIYIDPNLVKNVLIPSLYLPFFILFFPASFFSLALLLADSMRGLIFCLGLMSILILRIYGLGNWLNLLLIIGIVFVVDGYLKS